MIAKVNIVNPCVPYKQFVDLHTRLQTQIAWESHIFVQEYREREKMQGFGIKKAEKWPYITIIQYVIGISLSTENGI